MPPTVCAAHRTHALARSCNHRPCEAALAPELRTAALLLLLLLLQVLLLLR